MILIAYKRVEGARKELEEAVWRAFSSKNSDYINEISGRKNQLSAQESLNGLLLLSKLAKKLGFDTEKLILRRDKNGKPYFEGAELYFSISHSQGIVAVAASDSCEVGIDVEAAQMNEDRAVRLSERYFGGKQIKSPNELLRLWVRTEAYVKLCGKTLAEGIGTEIPDDVYFYDCEILGFPASVSYLGEQKIEII